MSAERRVRIAVRHGQIRALLGATAVIAAVMFVFEAVKSAIWPVMTLWESHWLTIVFSTVVGALAVASTLRIQSRLQLRLLNETSERHRLEEISARLAEHAVQLETANTRLTEETAARRRLERDLLQAQKMESIGRIAGGLAHDFNNVLTVVLSSIDLAERPEAPAPEVAADLRAAREAAAQAVGLTRQLLAFARHQPVEAVPVKIDALLQATSEVMRRLVGEAITINIRLNAQDALVRGVPSQLEQVLLNLVANAADAMPDGGTVRVATSVITLQPSEHGVLDAGGEFIQIEVRDSGMGIPEDAFPRLFEPFYTTKGKGTGLGLATTYAIAARGGGHVEAHNNAGHGATFRVLLPRFGDTVKTAEHAVPLRSTLRVGRVLLVEDQESVRETVRRLLVTSGFEVATAANGRLALDLAESWSAAPDLLITDVVMPELGGRSVAAALRERWPTLPVLFMSGYTDEEVLRDDDPSARFLQKPFTRTALLEAVGALRPSEPLPA